MDYDGHFVDNIVNESVDVEKIVETQMMIEAVRNAISRLNAEEKDIIKRLYSNGKTVIPFCTHGGGGFGNMIEEYKRECGTSCVIPGLAVKGTYTFSEVQKWLELIGLNDASASS